MGRYYADQQHLPSVDSDYYQAGFLLADYLVRAGHRQMALFAAADGRPGDHAFYDGLSESLTRANLPHNSLSIRIYPRLRHLRAPGPPGASRTRSSYRNHLQRRDARAAGYVGRTEHRTSCAGRCGDLLLRTMHERRTGADDARSKSGLLSGDHDNNRGNAGQALQGRKAGTDAGRCAGRIVRTTQGVSAYVREMLFFRSEGSRTDKFCTDAWKTGVSHVEEAKRVYVG